MGTNTTNVSKQETALKRAAGYPTYGRKKPDAEPDWGKAQALRDAGWGVGSIAKELGVMKIDVAHHTHKPEKRKKFENEWAEAEPNLFKENQLI
jgi:hypothetical protein